jgi:hypothetical protein
MLRHPEVATDDFHEQIPRPQRRDPRGTNFHATLEEQTRDVDIVGADFFRARRMNSPP